MLMRSLMMEEKQLDFNRPLLSVRRPTQTSESENKTRSLDSVNNKIPPSPPVYKSDIKSGPVRNPGTVPFQWEHKPGKPKDERKPELQSTMEPHFVPKLPPGRVMNGRERVVELGRKPETRADHQTKSNGDNISSLDKYHHVEDAKSYSSRFDDDNDDTYLDANDTLSRSESFFFNCSAVSGMSGLDGSGLLVEPFGTLSSDRQTQDLMMGRFLPAAKALTSETPPHLARKPPKPEEPTRQLMKKVVVVKEKQNNVEQNPYRFHHLPDQEEEDTSSMASGVCGLVPQICLRSSLGLLNPVPSVRMQAQKAVSVRRMRSKYQDSSPSHETQSKQNNETVSKDKRKLTLNESVVQGSSQPEGKEILENFGTASRTKVSKNFGELLASDDNTWKPSSEAPVAEKTLYVDTVHSVDKKVQEETKEQSLVKEYPSLDIVPVKDVQNLIGGGEEAISQAKSTEQINDNRDEEFTKFSSQKVEDCPEQDCNHLAIIAMPESKVVEITKEKIDLEVQSQRIPTKLESSRLHHRSSYHIVPPPPLPKAPSDSWLKRTLPTIPSKINSFTWLQSLENDNNHFSKTQANPKWETMVKTSNIQQGSVCFSKETLNPIPEAEA